MERSESFEIEISLPAVECGEKIFKRISKVLPKGTAIRFVTSSTKYSDVKLGFGQARPKEEGVITINR
jgi:hypothetical protein